MKNYKIGELCSFSKGASIPRDRMLQSGTINYLHYGDLYKGHNLYINIEDQETPIPFISSFEKVKDSQYAKDGDIIYVLTSETVEDLGKALLLQNPNHQIVVAGTETTIMHVDKKDIIEPAYLNYLLQTKCFKKILQQYTTGMKVFRVHPRDISRIEINVPNIKKQRAIIKILDQIHFKIRINNRINDYLNEIAQTLFNNWFVDFGHWGGEMPHRWEIGTLGKYVTVKRGGSPRPIQEYLSESGLRWLKIADVTGVSGPFIMTIKEHIREEGIRKTVHLQSGSLVLSNSATPGIPKIVCIDTCIHDGWLYFPESEFSNEWLYCYFQNVRKQLARMANGSVFQNLKIDIVKNFEVIRPSDEVLADFQEIISPIFRLMEACQKESQNLIVLRDRFLPRLMSGEIDVSKVEVSTQLNNHLYDCLAQFWYQ